MKKSSFKNYVFMWAEENENYHDSEYLFLNYGRRAKELFGQGIEEMAVFYKDFHAEFYLTEEELKRNRESGYDFFMQDKNYELLLN